MSQRLIKQYREMAGLGGNFRGFSLIDHAGDIAAVCARHRPRTLLDYGSGAGDAYRTHAVHHDWHVKRVNITLYDPAFPHIDRLPTVQFDGVICSDVLEHLPEDEVDMLICNLFNFAKMFVWASVCCRPAKKTFPDGTNLHVTVKPIDWWRERFAQACSGQTFYLVETP